MPDTFNDNGFLFKYMNWEKQFSFFTIIIRVEEQINLQFGNV